MAAPTLAEDPSQQAAPPEGTLFLQVLGPGFTATLPLPRTGRLLIGRVEDADVRIADPQVSRQHAVLALGPAVTIEDLGSANGTRVREERLPPNQPVPLGLGEAVKIGETLLTLRDRAAAAPVQIWPFEAFEQRLVDECSRAGGAGRPFGLLRIDPPSPAERARVEDLLRATLRPGDLVGAYGRSQYLVLLVDTAADACEALVGTLAPRLERALGPCRLTLARFPADGPSPQRLLASVGERPADGAPPAVGLEVILEAPAMRQLYALATRLAAGSISVLVTGETGVGKEVLAAAIHARSRRAGKPFLAVNCAAFSETLLESELFGHEKGAFTGAVQAREGVLERAAGGTLFLDEVGEMSAGLQAKMLRVLETGEFTRLGGTRPRTTDVRIVAATNRDLEAEIERKTFRADLYFRLNAAGLHVPPLRERREEILPLARLFLARAAARAGDVQPPALSDEAAELLTAYSWPGNVRELRNVIERALLLVEAGAIRAEHLPAERMRGVRTAAPVPQADVGGGAGGDGLRDRLAHLERQTIVEALQRCGGNKTRAAELLGMPRTTFFARLAKLQIP